MKAIAAMTPGGVIGVDGRLPWHIPADLAHFKALTTGGTVVMGRSTFESIGRPLPGRHNVVLTRNPAYVARGCEVLTDLNEVYRRYPDAWVIGGAEVYAALMPWTTELHLTVVKAPEPQEGTLTRFPSLRGAWYCGGRRRREAGEQTPFDLLFKTYRRM